MIFYFEGKLLLAYAVLCLLVLCIVYIIRRQDRKAGVIFCCLLSVYLYYVIKLTQFPIYTGEIFAEDLSGNIWQNINLYPIKGALNLGSVKNIILTIPFGFLIPLTRTKKTTLMQMLIVGFCFGVLLEGLQLLQLLVNTFTFRVIDVNDVLLNATGVIIGFACYRAMRAVILKISFNQQTDTNCNSVASYLEAR